MNTFNFNRLGKVIVNDLRRAWQNYGYSFLILALMPAVFCLFYTFMPLVFGASFHYAAPWARTAVLGFTVIALIVSFPSKVYGNLTDKRYGTDYLMLPASTLEKFVSMVLVTAVIVPVLFVAGFMAVDAILSAVGLYEGGTLVAFLNDSAVMNNDFITLNLWSYSMVSLALNMLIFLLGAIYFKKGKAALTILSLFALSLAFSIIIGLIVPHIDGEWIEQLIEGRLEEWMERNVDRIELYLNLVINTFRVIGFSIVGGLIYLRLKTLKH